jgi:hypothetical protein
MTVKRYGLFFCLLCLAAALGPACQDRSTPVQELGNLGDPCLSSYDCMSDLVCAASGTCQDPGDRPRGTAAEGESCLVDECRYGLTCCGSLLSDRRGCTPNVCVRPGDVGDRCAATEDCRLGTVCDETGTCAVDGVAAVGEPCAVSGECAWGLVCSSAGTCREPGEGAEGDACAGTEDCRPGLLCAGDATCRDPDDASSAPHGMGGLGEECAATSECLLHMTCFLDGTCQVPRTWPGAYCAADDPDDPEPFRVYYEIPALPHEGELDFYRLPFPNDIRIRAGKVQLDGHPVPDVEIAGGAVQAYLDAVEESATAFSTQPTVFMRFSRSPDFDTIRLASVCETCEMPSEDPPECPSGCAKWLYRNFYIVNITPPADPADPDYAGYGEGHSFGMAITTGRGKYICQNNIALRPADGAPLRPGATYAVIVTDTANPAEGIRTAEGETLIRDDDFDALVEGLLTGDCAGASGGNADVENACRLPSYQRLADYLGDSSILDYDPNWGDHLKAAAVFTTLKPSDGFATFRDKVYDCAGADCSNLPEATPEGFAENAALAGPGYRVYDGAVRMPVFQSGTPPYLDGGGEILYAGDGTVQVAPTPSSDFHRVALSLAVPDSTDMPADGWPVVIYMHDLQTDPAAEGFHAYLEGGAAEDLASVTVELGDPPAPVTARFAVLSIEGVMHGGRTGLAYDASPAPLYHNLLNPHAARDNVLQAAADGYQIMRFIDLVHETAVSGGSFPGLSGVDLDPGRVYLMARGEGGRAAVIFTAFEPLVRAAVITQAGGPVTASLVSQRAPIDLAGSMAVLVAEKNPGTMHPVVSLMQNLFDPVDPVNYGRFIIHGPPQIGETADDPPVPVLAGPHHLLVIMGRDDPAAPESSMLSLISTFGIHQFDNDAADCRCGDGCDAPSADGLHDAVCSIGGMDRFTDDVRGNLRGGLVTGGLSMFTAAGSASPHDVIFDSADAASQVAGFFASADLDAEGIPTIFAP